ncbi:uncharacterized protein BJX67DRAFT_160907 [Aspergillus lucknowensis]|uniref:Uncharacterized protein n=1 Tax=Aspergillus lucknowensis TaxID=176173 RepID=A0ABR4M4A7_9EURO
MSWPAGSLVLSAPKRRAIALALSSFQSQVSRCWLVYSSKTRRFEIHLVDWVGNRSGTTGTRLANLTTLELG